MADVLHATTCQRNSKNCRGLAVFCTIGRFYSEILRSQIEKEILRRNPKSSLVSGLESPQ
jgi:hypothetical protein